ncbi:hypothetical protein VUR80DRAFT_8781 [Thermomyces stellatus]
MRYSQSDSVHRSGTLAHPRLQRRHGVSGPDRLRLSVNRRSRSRENEQDYNKCRQSQWGSQDTRPPHVGSFHVPGFALGEGGRLAWIRRQIHARSTSYLPGASNRLHHVSVSPNLTIPKIYTPDARNPTGWFPVATRNGSTSADFPRFAPPPRFWRVCRNLGISWGLSWPSVDMSTNITGLGVSEWRRSGHAEDQETSSPPGSRCTGRVLSHSDNRRLGVARARGPQPSRPVSWLLRANPQQYNPAPHEFRFSRRPAGVPRQYQVTATAVNSCSRRLLHTSYMGCHVVVRTSVRPPCFAHPRERTCLWLSIARYCTVSPSFRPSSNACRVYTSYGIGSKIRLAMTPSPEPHKLLCISPTPRIFLPRTPFFFSRTPNSPKQPQNAICVNM